VGGEGGAVEAEVVQVAAGFGHVEADRGGGEVVGGPLDGGLAGAQVGGGDDGLPARRGGGEGGNENERENGNGPHRRRIPAARRSSRVSEPSTGAPSCTA